MDCELLVLVTYGTQAFAHRMQSLRSLAADDQQQVRSAHAQDLHVLHQVQPAPPAGTAQRLRGTTQEYRLTSQRSAALLQEGSVDLDAVEIQELADIFGKNPPPASC